MTSLLLADHRSCLLIGAPHLGDYFPFLPLLLLDPQGLTSRMKKVSKIFDKFLDTIIDEHQKFEHHPSDSDDFVSTMLSLMRSGDIDFEFDHRHVKGVLDMVVKESFRLHPPAPLLLPHAAIQDCTVEGYHIPKESRIIINAWSIGRDPNTWTNPEEFVPERFNHGNNNNNNNVSSKIDVWGKNFELIPFGSGRRGCPGMQLGFLAVRLIVAQLAHCFNWKLPEGMLPEELLASSSMAAFLCFLLLSSFQTLSAQQRQFNISLGSSLSPQGPNSSWLSASGIFAFGFYRQGDNGYAVGVFIAGIQEQTAVWTANRDNSRVVASENSTTLQLTTDGKLLLLGQQQNKSVLGLSNPSDSIATASMLDSGNFVLYNSVHNIIWQSFDYATNSLLPGQSLLAGKEQELISSASGTDDSKGTFLLKMQKDGYLVQYPVGTPYSIPYAYWQPLNAPGLGEASSLSLDNDGRLYLSNSTFTHVIFPGGDSRTVKLHLAKVDVDGIFRLYSHSINQGSWTKEWEALSDECAPKGICGFNSYCIRQGNGAVCECLPGFAFLNETNKKLGCVRNSTIEICKQENGRAATEYDFRPSENIAWVASPYAVSIKSTRAECQDACQDDCNCQVVFFDGRNCTMQKFPLRFGRRNLEESTVALIKVSKNVVGANSGEQTNLPTTTTTTTLVKRKEVRLDILIPSVSFFTVAVLFLVITGVLIHHRKLWEYKLIANSTKVHLNDHEAPQAFTYAELQQATNGFKEKLGEGAFGHVYKGFLPERQKEIAVKRLEKVFAEGGAEVEFQNELRMIGKTHHRNLVRLLGFCLEGNQRLLVYEYMANGSLADLLFEQETRPSLKERIALALDIARGILYLHEECEAQTIIHCDIKPQNILLDKQWRARISDFGLAKLLNYNQTKTYTGIRGTKGYVAPEWHKRLPITVKADVYSYGIVLLEILCCRRSVDTSLPEDEIVLEYLAYSCFETGNLKKLVAKDDDEEEEEVDKTKLLRMIKIAFWCIQDDPSLRPSIKKVMLMLEGTVDIPTPPSPSSILSTI